MKQSIVFKLSFFVALIIGYLYLYDPSTKSFVSFIKSLADLKVSFTSLFYVISWIVGLLGLLTLMNLKGKREKLFFWIVFFVSYALNFSYQKIFGQSFNANNIHLTANILDEFNKIHTLDFLKFLLINLIFFGLVYFVGPLGMDLNKIFMITLLVLAFISVALYGGAKVQPMQSFYTMPVALVYGILIKSWVWLKIKLGLKFI